MEKKVYCIIDEQCKCVKFTSVECRTDIDIIRNKLISIFARDPILQIKASNKYILFQKKHEKKDLWIDIDEDDESVIEDDTELKVMLMKFPSIDETISPIKPSSSSPSTSTPHVDLNRLHDSNKRRFEVNNDIKMEVLWTEPVANDHQKPSPYSNEVTKEGYLSSDEAGNDPTIQDHGIEYYNIGVPVVMPPPSKKSKYFILPDLPALPLNLKNKIESKGVLHNQAAIISFYAQYLYTITDGEPKNFYKDWSMKIVDSVPELKCRTNGYDVVRKQLSQWTRNHRVRAKAPVPTADPYKKNVVLVDSEPSTSSKTGSNSKNDVEIALKELVKRKREGNTHQVRRLLDITFKFRRDWIEGSLNDTITRSIVDIIREYPHLEKYDLILYEFQKIKNILEDDSITKVTKLLEDVGNYFRINPVDERSKVGILVLLYEELKSSSKGKKNEKPLIAMETTGSSTSSLTSLKTESPRAVIFFDELKITTAVIVADEKINLEVLGLTTEQILITLFATYYVWNVGFPKAYKNFLEYIDHQIFGATCKNTTVLKFMRKIENHKRE